MLYQFCLVIKYYYSQVVGDCVTMPPVQSFLNLVSLSTGQNNRALFIAINLSIVCMCFYRCG